MIPVASFDFLPTDDFYPELFSELPEREAYSTKFDRLNYGSMYLIINMGTLLMFFAWLTLLYLLYPIAYITKKRNKVTKWIE